MYMADEMPEEWRYHHNRDANYDPEQERFERMLAGLDPDGDTDDAE